MYPIKAETMCYEFAFSHGFRYVSVESGKLVCF